MASNQEILGIAADLESASVLVQMPNGTFRRMTPSEAKAHTEKESKLSLLAIALRNFLDRQKQYEQEMSLLHHGGSDPSGKEIVSKILGRRSTR